MVTLMTLSCKITNTESVLGDCTGSCKAQLLYCKGKSRKLFIF